MWHDLRFALRALLRSPAFTLVGVGTLALAIGANTAIFTLINAVWLRPAPVSDPDRLAVICFRVAGSVQDMDMNYMLQSLIYGKLTTATTAFESPETLETMTPRVVLPGGRRLSVQAVSHNYFSVLGVPVRGRGFQPADDAPQTPTPVVIGHDLWRAEFDADPAVIGRTIQLSGTPSIVVGIAPMGFRGPRLGDSVELWVPARAAGPFLGKRQRLLLAMMPNGVTAPRLFVRFNAGVTLPQVESELKAAIPTFSHLKTIAESAYPTRAQASEAKDRQLAWLLAVTAGLVLLVGCANLTSLLLARAERRRGELGVRLAIGISRGRLVWMLMSEALVLAVLGGMAALVVSRLLLRTLASYSLPTGIALTKLDLSLDVRVAAFTALVSLATILVCALLPAWQASRTDVSRLFGSSRFTPGGTRLTARGLLLAGHVALALVLLIGTSLFVVSIRRAYNEDLAFDARRTVFVTVMPDVMEYVLETASGPLGGLDTARRQADTDAFNSRLRGLDGVEGVTSGSSPLREPARDADRQVRREVVTGGVRHEVALVTVEVGAGYCTTLGIPIVAGRDLRPEDAAEGQPRVAVVGEGLARVLWPGGNAVGQRLSIAKEPIDLTGLPGLDGRGQTAEQKAAMKKLMDEVLPQDLRDVEVVGVAKDSVRRGVRGATLFTVYTPPVINATRQFMAASAQNLAVRTRGPAKTMVPAITTTVKQIFPANTFLRITLAEDAIASQMQGERMGATLFTWFAGVALALCLLGICGLVAYTVARRSHEIGIRLALGAQASSVMRLMAMSGLVPVAAGCVAGLAAAAATTRLIAGFLFETSPVDPLTFALCTLAFLATAALASYLPARRALRLDPVNVLRAE